jgi:two-component system CheB/CheR fusion protein
MVLERHHCTVHTADTAEDAMQQLQSGIRPDVLVTDYRLPGNSGTQLVESAREALGHNIPAVIITGDMSGDAIKIEHLPAIEVLHKPTNLKRLVGTIVRLANQQTLKHNPVVEGTTRL